MVEPTALLALALEAAVGWPTWLYNRIGHPVGCFARVIGACEQRWNTPTRSFTRRRMFGGWTLILTAAVAAVTALIAQFALVAAFGKAAWIGVALLAAPGLAQRSLHDHVSPVSDALADDNLPCARQAVAMIVGRDVAKLDSAGVARAAIESLAESFCDGVVAPLFWLLVFGLPGLWGYKAINTADSLIGHREERWRAFGWAAARADDVANFLPARLAGIIVSVAGGGGWRTMWRDARKHASPNAGWPEAAMAGALNLQLAGPVSYDGATHAKPWIGSGRLDADARDIRHGLAIYRRACALLWIMAGIVAWVR